jgi:hypothetical protein
LKRVRNGKEERELECLVEDGGGPEFKIQTPASPILTDSMMMGPRFLVKRRERRCMKFDSLDWGRMARFGLEQRKLTSEIGL